MNRIASIMIAAFSFVFVGCNGEEKIVVDGQWTPVSQFVARYGELQPDKIVPLSEKPGVITSLEVLPGRHGGVKTYVLTDVSPTIELDGLKPWKVGDRVTVVEQYHIIRRAHRTQYYAVRGLTVR